MCTSNLITSHGSLRLTIQRLEQPESSTAHLRTVLKPCLVFLLHHAAPTGKLGFDLNSGRWRLNPDHCQPIADLPLQGEHPRLCRPRLVPRAGGVKERCQAPPSPVSTTALSETAFAQMLSHQGSGDDGRDQDEYPKELTFIEVGIEHASRSGSKKQRRKRQQFVIDHGTASFHHYIGSEDNGLLNHPPFPDQSLQSLLMPLPLVELFARTPLHFELPPQPPPSPLRSLHPSLLAFALLDREDEFAAELAERLERVVEELKNREWDLNNADIWEVCTSLPDESESDSDD
ncbi:uncharacterized protein F5891DRAFT_985290 [Suillus fuscotomentosus]|uniref:Uncharacterized protein n=1 Tax=Suillus fuscotomentosus TaxID=1912939 RepID=A0AAD4HFD9_9AGAM|nr:uncharacterized protein F5891DRAFT_985290 [Suillus fuscotomentosus]KAG1894176.1 hypothetical protein F5891DRAFT_985290 [Suillus fuscotomentosus]